MNNIIDHYGTLTLLKLYIQPGANKDEVIGVYGETPRLKLKIKSRPIDGKANKRVVSFLSTLLNLKRSDIQILRSETSRKKDFILNADYEAIESILNKIL